jgi:chorismate mutase
MEGLIVSWKVRSIRGATTCAENTEADMREAVTELLHEIETLNSLDLSEVVHVTFSVTQDLDQIFPAAIARTRKGWDFVPLLDVQHMHVAGGLPKCIRCLIQFNTQYPEQPIHHVYLREAQALRPDLCLPVQAAI